MKPKCAACIFDMDDTLVDTTNIWRKAEQRMLDFYSVPWDDTYDRLFKGLSAPSIASTVQTHLQIKADHTQILRVLRDSLIEEFGQQPIRPIDGAISLVKKCAERVPVAVASGSPMPAIQQAMQRVNLLDHFTVILSSESVARGKPHPDVFLETAKQLGVNPKDCVVFEDSIPGTQAAQQAGARCFLRPSLPLTDAPEGVERVVTSWEQVAVDALC